MVKIHNPHLHFQSFESQFSILISSICFERIVCEISPVLYGPLLFRFGLFSHPIVLKWFLGAKSLLKHSWLPRHWEGQGLSYFLSVVEACGGPSTYWGCYVEIKCSVSGLCWWLSQQNNWCGVGNAHINRGYSLSFPIGV
jgi:hypothetical protein